ncbi:MAG: triose-phosphate isomerase [Fimbriimonadaceae bacterium]
MRTKLVVGNWKMHLTLAEAGALVEELLGIYRPKSDVDVAVCPGFVALARVRQLLKDSPLKLGAQDVFWEETGAFTGQVSPAMLADLCADYCIVGHSEARGRFGSGPASPEVAPYFTETNTTLHQKVEALLFRAITPILCVGETVDEREAGQAESTVQAQLEGALRGFDPTELYGVVVAYEPVWAIGTGKVCEPEEAGRMCGVVRQTVSELADADVGANLRVLYGGSLKPDNSFAIFQQAEVDGGLVGGASLSASSFAQIVHAA